MANIISLQFSDQIQTRVGRLDYTGDHQDNTDIEYWIGTEGYTVPYANVSQSGEITSSFGLGSSTWNRSSVIDNGVTISSVVTWNYTNYRLLPNYIILFMRTASGKAGNVSFDIQMRNETNAYETIASRSLTGFTGSSYIEIPLKPDFWSQGFRFLITSGVSVIIDEVYTYGAFARENNSTLGLFPANSTVENVKDSQLNINSIIGPLDYIGALTSKQNIILNTTRLVLTGTYQIEDKAESIILSLDPNNSNRDVILPAHPKLDHYLKIINVDGSNLLNIKETSGGPIIQELSNSSTVLTVECFWDATDKIWHIVG